MLSLHFLCRQLGHCLMQETPLRSRDACPHQVELLDAQPVLHSDRLYLGDPRSVPLLERVQAEPGTLILLADMADRPVPPPPPGCELLAFTCSLFKLYNTVAEDVRQTDLWQQAYQHISEQSGHVHDILGAAAGFADDTLWLAALLTDEEINSRHQKYARLDARAEELAKSAALAQEKIALLTAKIDPALELTALLGEIAALRETMNNLSAAKGRLQGLIETDDAQKKRLADKLEAIRSQEKKLGVWTQLNALIGSADGKRYRTFVQSMTFETLLHHANRALAKISQRYILKKDATEPLKLNVIDTFQGGVERSADNLSGGESFLVSLSLALGLSEMASRNVRVESLFLDEGFGSLDPDTLEDAMNALAALQSEGKMIGIISHVGEVRERIATLIDVTPVSGGRSELSGPGVERLEEKKK